MRKAFHFSKSRKGIFQNCKMKNSALRLKPHSIKEIQRCIWVCFRSLEPGFRGFQCTNHTAQKNIRIKRPLKEKVNLWIMMYWPTKHFNDFDRQRGLVLRHVFQILFYGKLGVVRVLTSQWGFTRPSSIYFNLGIVRDIVPLFILFIQKVDNAMFYEKDLKVTKRW